MHTHAGAISFSIPHHSFSLRRVRTHRSVTPPLPSASALFGSIRSARRFHQPSPRSSLTCVHSALPNGLTTPACAHFSLNWQGPLRHQRQGGYRLAAGIGRGRSQGCGGEGGVNGRIPGKKENRSETTMNWTVCRRIRDERQRTSCLLNSIYASELHRCHSFFTSSPALLPATRGPATRCHAQPSQSSPLPLARDHGDPHLPSLDCRCPCTAFSLRYRRSAGGQRNCRHGVPSAATLVAIARCCCRRRTADHRRCRCCCCCCSWRRMPSPG